MEDYQKCCPECELDYHANRLNQVFCSIKCKAQYNNRKAREQGEQTLQAQQKIDHVTGYTNAILWRNRNVLKAFVGQKISLDIVTKQGFQTNYITSFGQGKTQQNIFYCYDVAFVFINQTTIEVLS
jgi:hypothetical protein